MDRKRLNAAGYILVVSALIEVATGVMLVIDPAIVVNLLFGSDASGGALLIGRVCGIGLLALGIACWPSRQRTGTIAPAFNAMLTYNVLVALYLIYLGSVVHIQALLLWPAAALHTIIGLALIWDLAAGRSLRDLA